MAYSPLLANHSVGPTSFRLAIQAGTAAGRVHFLMLAAGLHSNREATRAARPRRLESPIRRAIRRPAGKKPAMFSRARFRQFRHPSLSAGVGAAAEWFSLLVTAGLTGGALFEAWSQFFGQLGACWHRRQATQPV